MNIQRQVAMTRAAAGDRERLALEGITQRGVMFGISHLSMLVLCTEGSTRAPDRSWQSAPAALYSARGSCTALSCCPVVYPLGTVKTPLSICCLPGIDPKTQSEQKFGELHKKIGGVCEMPHEGRLQQRPNPNRGLE
ncbi:unnamed protein product [Pleuronectes platessa]|uniref:Uncharacterized protein n=1 Tax=Pleuronectes platessa TaxID=8262 RepID=A0A9N7THM5_PLEPL|nr:unnamed protein product [Pleuronectes platessa]